MSDYPLVLLAPTTAGWCDIFRVNTPENFATPFRLYVYARDGRWYKQPSPALAFDAKLCTHAHVLCFFGDVEVPAGSRYLVVAVAADDSLGNILTAIPTEKQLSSIHEVTRV